MGPIEQRLTTFLEPSITGLGYELIGIEYVSGTHHPVVRIYIDKPDGIGVDDCERVSRQVSAVLDVEDPVQGHYTLEVSSPGLDRPLFTAAHYERVVGEEIKAKLHRPIAGRRNFKGTLLSVREGEVVIEVDGEERVLPLSDIERARLVPKW